MKVLIGLFRYFFFKGRCQLQRSQKAHFLQKVNKPMIVFSA
jgi:hypothetical protein